MIATAAARASDGPQRMRVLRVAPSCGPGFHPSAGCWFVPAQYPQSVRAHEGNECWDGDPECYFHAGDADIFQLRQTDAMQTEHSLKRIGRYLQGK